MVVLYILLSSISILAIPGLTSSNSGKILTQDWNGRTIGCWGHSSMPSNVIPEEETNEQCGETNSWQNFQSEASNKAQFNSGQ